MDIETKDDWVSTYSGQQFWLMNPDPALVNIRDIAHALSQICRFNGHTKRFLSVAQHCINVVGYMEQKGCSSEACLYGLLHDAAEAYICDLPRPIKRLMPEYNIAEKKILNTIFTALGLKYPNKTIEGEVAEADNAMLYFETLHYMQKNLAESLEQFKWEPQDTDILLREGTRLCPSEVEELYISYYIVLKRECRNV